MAKLVIDPVTRIEGHLRITCEISGGKVVDAWNTCTLFRGFEIFMKDRHPADCWHFAQRICGVCPTPHAINSVTACERAMGVETVPDNARLVRNMLWAAQMAYDTVLWFYPLNALDYVNVPNAGKATTKDPTLKAIQDRVVQMLSSGQVGPFSNMYWDHPGYVLSPEQDLALVGSYVEALTAQQYANQAQAVLAGKFPMIMTLAAGGMTKLPSIEQIIYYQDQITRTNDFIATTMWNDLLAVATAYKSLAATGRGVANYLTWGILEDKSQKAADRIFPPGGIFEGDLTQVYDVDPADVKIHTRYSYYPDSLGGGRSPLDSGQTPQEFSAYPPIDGPDLPSGKYDWTRAARYPSAKKTGTQVPMEVGPLSEVLVGYVRGQGDIKKYVDEVLAALGVPGKPEVLMSNLGRVAARVIKGRVNADWSLQWSQQLLDNVKAGDTEVYIEPPNPNGKGTGVSGQDAPRGALSHYCEIDGGLTKRYAAVPASNWNLAPRDDNGTRGPVEEALIGMPVEDPTRPLEILRVVHSFDP